MDEVLQQFENTLISRDTDSKTNFEGLYKNWGKLGNQEERRKEILEVQKSNRNTKLDRFRGILELVNAVEQGEIFATHQKAYYRPTIYVAGFNKVSLTYNNVLMMSEWIIEKPEDLSDNWYVVPCPKGIRVLVVANNGITKFYTKYGQFKFEKSTALPGGNDYEYQRKRRCCVLDGFYYEKNNTLCILDVLAWNSQPMTDGETEFRHYWLESQLAEIPELKGLSRKNRLIFKLLPKVPCNTESFNKFMTTYPVFEENQPPVDGLLFYHKRAHYSSGDTPLIGWLFPFMVPEVFGDDYCVHEKYMDQKPDNYVNSANFILSFEEKLGKKKKRGDYTPSNAMDTADNNNTQADKKNKSKSNKNKSKESSASSEMETADGGSTEDDNRNVEELNKENKEGSSPTNEMETTDMNAKDKAKNEKKPIKEAGDACSLTNQMETVENASTEKGGKAETEQTMADT